MVFQNSNFKLFFILSNIYALKFFQNLNFKSFHLYFSNTLAENIDDFSKFEVQELLLVLSSSLELRKFEYFEMCRLVWKHFKFFNFRNLAVSFCSFHFMPTSLNNLMLFPDSNFLIFFLYCLCWKHWRFSKLQIQVFLNFVPFNALISLKIIVFFQNSNFKNFYLFFSNS